MMVHRYHESQITSVQIIMCTYITLFQIVIISFLNFIFFDVEAINVAVIKKLAL